MPLGQRFDAQKAIEAVLFIANRVDDPTFHRVSKLLYFADLKKLEEYGSLVVGDQYIAMKYGPVPSTIYDIFKSVRGDGGRVFKLLVKGAFEVEDSTVNPCREEDDSLLSEADIESLQFAIDKYGKYSFNKLTRVSHDAAWKSAKADDRMDFLAIAKVAGGKRLVQHLVASEKDDADSERVGVPEEVVG